MAPDEKPYRVYRGGRTKGKVPSVGRTGLPRRDGGARGGRGGDGATAAPPSEYRGPGARPRRPNWRRRILLGVLVLVVLFVVWGVASYLQFSSGVADANKRLSPDVRSALDKQSGLLLSHSTTILLLGTDNSALASRSGDRHSDSILLLRTDPSHHRLYYLSIPRDLEVPIPGLGTTKINAAMQAGGTSLALRTIEQFTGIPIQHVVLVNFGDFKDLIDALGGVTIDVPKPILSDRFDCPYKTEARCQEWKGWRFAKGNQHMNGERALIYSRVRVNQLDPSESDITREARQQAVIQAVMARFTSPGVMIDLPFDGSKLAKPLSTDLTASQLMQLAWVKFRSSNGSAVHCRLGGDLGAGGNGSPSEDDPLTIAMFLGRSAPQPPPPGQPFAPGCEVGHTLQ
ncbi:MAG TPA: LCP family protein [Gaiellaceae bacterium]|jgi:LCP family protein required for cell wall assembly